MAKAKALIIGSKEDRGKKTIERVKKSGLPHTFIYNKIGISGTNFSRFMTEKQGGVTEGLIKKINDFLDTHNI